MKTKTIIEIGALALGISVVTPARADFNFTISFGFPPPPRVVCAPVVPVCAPPVVVVPRPVFAPAVIVAPRPYCPPPVVVRAPVCAPQPVVVVPSRPHRHWDDAHRGHGRWGRDDDRGRGHGRGRDRH